MNQDIKKLKKAETKANETFIEYLKSFNNQHLFNINGVAVKAVFSNKNDAPDIESLLVKIASGKDG